MRAYAAEVEHRRSNNDNKTTAIAVPGAPTNLTAMASGTNTINLSWTAPTNNGGTAITGYRIEALSTYENNIGQVGGENAGRWRILKENTGDTAVSYSHTGLSPNTVLSYRVLAINNDGVSESSNEDEARTGLLGGGTAPTVTSIAVNDTEIVITFNQILDATSIPNNVFFPIKVSGKGGDLRPEDVAIQGAKVTLTLAENDGVNNGEMVYVRYHQPTYIDGDVFLPFSSGSLKSPAGNPVEKFIYENATNNTPPRIVLVLNPISINENGGTATLTATIPSAITEEVTLTLTPEPVSPAVDTSLTISGTTLTMAQGATTSTETLTITTVDNDVREGHKMVKLRVLRANHPIGLVSAKPFTVALIIIDDESPPPLSTPFISPSEPLPPSGSTPDPPLYLRSTPGNEQVRLTWSPPFYDRGDIIGYAYRYRESSQVFGLNASETWSDIPGGADARNYTVTGLTNGVEYMLEVRAENAHAGGTSAYTIARLLLGNSGGQPTEGGGFTPVNTENEELPTEVALLGNYPNPFNPATTINYELPQTSEVYLAVYDLIGHEAAVLVDGLQSAGRHTVQFNASDLPSGPYIYRLQTGDKIVARTMILVK